MKKEVNDVEDYIAVAPPWAKETLKELRRVIKLAAPKATESISYRMPYYSQNGRLAYFGAYTNHTSFHWISGQDKKTFAKELAKVQVVGSTLQIPKGKKVPVVLIKKIVEARVKTNELKKKK